MWTSASAGYSTAAPGRIARPARCLRVREAMEISKKKKVSHRREAGLPLLPTVFRIVGVTSPFHQLTEGRRAAIRGARRAEEF